MKFIVSSITLLKQLQSISGALASNNTLPILDNFLFEVESGNLTVSASDLETTMSTKVAIKSDSKGSIAIPAKDLLDYLKLLPEIPVTFSINVKTCAVELTAGEGKSSLAGASGDEYPKIPKIESSNSVEINSHILATAVNKTLFATGNDDLRPVMSGVFCQLATDSLTFVATDAHKLVCYRRTDAKAGQATSFILPKKPLNLLKGILAAIDEPVKIEYNATNAFFAFGNTELICRLIDGKYPNYEAVIPKQNPNKLIIDRSAFLNTIKRVSIFSNKTTHQVRLKIAGSELNISAEDLDYNKASNDRLTCQYSGEDMEIGFNSRFLVEMLTNLETEEVVLEMSAPNRAGILLPHNSENKDESILMLVMPVMLNS